MANAKGRAGRQRFHYTFLRLLTGSDLSVRRLPLMLARAEEPGPAVWLTACAHGDEVGGTVVIQEVFRRLRRSPLRKGSLHAFPLLNPIGFETASRNVTLTREDLNRSFPGDATGSVAERMAHLIHTTILDSDPVLVMDLHNDWRSSIPYCVLDPSPGNRRRRVYRQLEEIGKQTGFVLVREDPHSPEAEGWGRTLSGSLLHSGIAALTLELGEANIVNEKNVEYGVRSVWNVLSYLGMVEEPESPFSYPLPEGYRDEILTYSSRPFCSSSGIIRFLVRPGEAVRSEQPVAKIYNPFGKRVETVRALRDGIVLGSADSSVVFPGVAMLAFGVRDAPGEARGNRATSARGGRSDASR